MTTQQILNESGCFLCIPGVTIADAIEIGLLNAIATLLTGGSSSLTQVYSGAAADPNGVTTPNDVTKPAVYYPNAGGTEWQWTGAAWV